MLFRSSKGSPKIYHWITSTKFYAKYAKDLVERHEIKRYKKVMILSFSAISLGVIFVFGNMLVRVSFLMLYGVMFYYFIFRIKSV